MSAGDAIHALNSTVVRVANSNMKGTFDPKKSYTATDVVYGGVDNTGQGKYALTGAIHHGTWASGTAIAVNETVFKDGKIYRAGGAITAANNTAANFNANFTLVTTAGNSPSMKIWPVLEQMFLEPYMYQLEMRPMQIMYISLIVHGNLETLL